MAHELYGCHQYHHWWLTQSLLAVGLEAIRRIALRCDGLQPSAYLVGQIAIESDLPFFGISLTVSHAPSNEVRNPLGFCSDSVGLSYRVDPAQSG